MVTGDPLHLEMSLAVMAVCACEAKGGLAFVARGHVVEVQMAVRQN